jgi:hypothetical protein
MVPHLNGLVARDQSCQGDDAAVPRRQTGPLPHISQKSALRVSLECRGNRPDILEGQ